MTNRGWNLFIIVLILACTVFIHAHLNSIGDKLYHLNSGRKSIKNYLIDNEYKIERLETNMKQVVESCGKYYKYY